MKTALRLLIVWLTGFPFLQQTYAQVVPDAGALRQQIERERVLPAPARPLLDSTSVPTLPAPLSDLRLTVKGIRFSGNTLIDSEKLEAIVAPYLNQPQTFAQLQEIAALVAQVYRDAGWVVRAYIPRQDVTEGIVTIQIAEALFGKVQLEVPVATRLRVTSLIDYFEVQQKTGKPLNARAFDRATLLADDLPGISVMGVMREGSQEQETDLLVSVKDKPLLEGDVSFDNAGARPTGKERLNLNASLAGLFTLADQLNINVTHTIGSDYLRASGTLPVGADGWRLGMNASNMRYKLITQEFAALDAQGASSAVGLEASYPIVRTRQKNLYFSAGADLKRFDNQSNGTTTTRYQSRTLTLGVTAHALDDGSVDKVSMASLIWLNGLLDLNGSPNQAADALTTQTEGRFNKFRYTLSRRQMISSNWSFQGMLAGQWANKNLDSSEKFYLGGASGVRAYPTSEGGGALGTLVNLELRRRIDEAFTFSTFYDWGQITINLKNDFPGSHQLNGYMLRGAGVSLTQHIPGSGSFKATWARRIGVNPNPTLNGSDQDGSLVVNTFWLTANFQF